MVQIQLQVNHLVQQVHFSDTSTQTVDNIAFSSGYNSGEIDADTDVLYQENRSHNNKGVRPDREYKINC